jgi:protein-S-isoprenylcysteine O-methyltransferase Ste14
MLPPGYFLLAIVVMAAIDRFVRVGPEMTRPATLLGLVPIAIGFALGIIGNLQFRRHDTTIKPFEQSSTVVKAGVFSFSRNPMYLGMNLILLGVGVLLGSAAPFIVIPIFAWLMTILFIVKEEASLETQFGEDYLDYKRRVRRWL